MYLPHNLLTIHSDHYFYDTEERCRFVKIIKVTPSMRLKAAAATAAANNNNNNKKKKQIFI